MLARKANRGPVALGRLPTRYRTTQHMTTLANICATVVAVVGILCSVASSPAVARRHVASHGVAAPDGQVHVGVGMHVRQIEFVCSHSRKLRVHFDLSLNWTDDRTLPSSNSPRPAESGPAAVWTPAVHVRNELQPTLQAKVDASVLSVAADAGGGNGGVVTLRRRLSVDVSCPMDFHAYPFDSQRCPLILASWALPDARLVFQWASSRTSSSNSSSSDNSGSSASLAVTAAPGALENVPDFHPATYHVVPVCTPESTPYGQFSCVRVEFVVRRVVVPHLVQVYIPLCVCVVVAFTSFWVRVPSVRIVIVMSTLLFALAIGYAAGRVAPSADHLRYLDMFTGTAVAFIVATLLEFCTVMYVFGRSSPTGDKQIFTETVGVSYELSVVPSNQMDMASRLLFPLMLLAFVTAYGACV